MSQAAVDTSGRTLKAPVRVEFDYTRSLGQTLSAFMTGLRDRRVIGGRTADGLVHVPPPEFDPVTHDAVTDFVAVGSTGTVTTWSWVADPVEGQPLNRPFAWALVQLDGADTPLLHAVDVASPADMSTGMRVQVRWAGETVGAITDIACFEPQTAATERPTAPETSQDPVAITITPVRLGYTYAASPEESVFFRGLKEGRLVSQRCPACQKVYIPPRGACPVDGVPTEGEIDLAGTGTVTTFCIVNVPFLGQKITPPYVSAYVLLDGADIAFLHLILGVEASEVRMGLRVRAVWRPEEEWGTTVENISHFEPTGEPDADFDTYRQHL